MRISPILALLGCISLAQACIEDRPRTVSENFCAEHCALRDSCWDAFTNEPNCRAECLDDDFLQKLSDEAVALYAECRNDRQCNELAPPEIGLERAEDCVRVTELTQGDDTEPPSVKVEVAFGVVLQCPADPINEADIVGIPPEEAANQPAPVAPAAKPPALCLNEMFNSVQPNEQCTELCSNWNAECPVATEAACLKLLCPLSSETLVGLEACLNNMCDDIPVCIHAELGLD